MSNNNVNIIETDTFELLKKFHIGKVILNVNENTITLEGLENQEGEIKIFCIEPTFPKESRCIFKHGSKNKKNFYLDVDEIIVDVPFKDILKSLELKSLLGYFVVSDMISE